MPKITAGQRDQTIDNIRNFAIVLIVLGHAIQYTFETAGLEFMDNYITKIIYSFHMPLFVFVSGWVTWGSSFGSWKSLLKRAQILLIPLIVWAFIVKFIDSPTLNRTDWLSYYRQVLTGQAFGWFLVMIFLCSCIQFAVMRVQPKYQPIVALLASALLFWKLNFLGNVGFLYLFFYAGYYINKYYKSWLIDSRKKWQIACAMILFSLIISYFWEFYTFLNNYYLTVFYKFISAAIWIITIFYLFYTVKITIFTKYFKNITLEIYVTHYVPLLLTLYLLRLNPLWSFNTDLSLFINSFIMFVVGLVATVTLVELIKRNKLLSVILYAKK